MAAPELLAGKVMDQSASLLNDTAKTIYTYAKQIPYLNMALQELKEFFELNEVPVVGTTSAIIVVPAGVTFVGFDENAPNLPDDLIEPQKLWERQHGIDPYIPMGKVDSLPRYMEGVSLNQLICYVWESQEIRFLPSNQIIDLKIEYIRDLFPFIDDEDGTINILNSATFLEYRNAGLCAEFIGENKTRADSLNNFASLGMDRVVGIGTKGRQAIMTRHRPFRAGWKRKSYG